MMPYNLGAIIFCFAVLAVLAMLVKCERTLEWCLLKSPGRRKRKPKSVGLPYTMLP